MLDAWHDILTAAKVADADFRAACRNPEEAQWQTLRAILRDNAGCDFGRAHGFARIGSTAALQAAVPLRSYDDFAPSIAKMADGASGILTSAPVIAFEETGGTSGGAKLIPYTAQSLAAFRRAILPSLHDLVRRRPAVAEGRLYAAISPALRPPRHTRGGLPIGLPNDAAYLGEDLLAPFAALLAVPPELGRLTDVGEWKRETLRHLASAPDLSFVSIWSPTFWLELTEGLGRSQWSHLDTISCWCDGPSAAYAARLAAQNPCVHIEPKGLLSTESAVTLAYESEPGCLPALNSAFLEFEHEGRYALLHQLEPGQNYHVIITTPGGLYRYDTKDRVRCLSISNGLPRLAFLGRCSTVSDLVGEKLDEAFVAACLARLAGPARLMAMASPKPHYVLHVAIPQAEAVEIVEHALRRNPQFAYARDMGQLGPVIAVQRDDFWHSFDTARQPLGVIKPTILQPLRTP